MQLEETAQQEERQITQMIINVGDINNEKGNVLIGCRVGDNADLSHNNREMNNKQNWFGIHPSFTPQQTQEWVNALGSQFNPQEFAFYA